MKAILVALLVLASALLSHGQQSGTVRVAIVGAGVGGGATAYYLSNFTSPVKFETTVFESLNRVGGRLYAVEIGGNRLNVGGDAWAQVNWYVRELAEAIDLPLDTGPFYFGNGMVGLYSGPGAIQSDMRKLVDDVKSDVGMGKALFDTELMLARNYRERGMTPFANISAFLQPGKMYEYTQRQTEKYLLSKGVDSTLLDDFVGPLCKVIYNQQLTMQSFAGMVSVLSVTSTPYSAAGGNDNLPRQLLAASKAQVNLSSTVRTISLSPDSTDANPVYLVDVLDNHSGRTTTYSFDAVVIAAPLEWTTIDIQVPVPFWQRRPWVAWNVLLVEALGLQPSYFGVDPVPDCLFASMNSSAPFAKVCVEALSNRTGGVYKIYGIFAFGEMSDQLLDEIFAGRQSTFQYSWPFTFPILDVIENDQQYQPLRLHTRLFSNNAMESIASAMECSTISARNAALTLISTYQ